MAISRKGYLVINPRKILLYLRGEKGAHKQKSEHYRPDNAISKAQLSGTPRDTVYSRGKGAHKQKTNNCRLRRLFGQKCSVRRGAMTIPPQLRWYCLLMCFRIKELWIVINVFFGARGDFRPVCRSTARRLPLSFRSPKSLQEGFRPHTDYTCRWLRVRALTGLSPAPVF